MMIILSIYLIFLFFCCRVIINLSLKKNFALDSNFEKPQSIHTTNIPRILGLTFILFYLSTYLLFNLDPLYKILILSCLLCSFIGIVEDINFNVNPKLRFFTQFACVSIIFFIFPEFRVLDDISFLPNFFDNYFFRVIFTIFAIITVVNSFNFMDGLNGFVILYSIIISLFLLKFSINEDLYQLLILLIFHLIIILFFNFPKSQAFWGDFGSYFLGFLFSLLFVIIDNNNLLIQKNSSSWFLANLLAYPAFEIFSTVIRRILSRKSPFYPDNNHIHSLLNKYFCNKLNLNNNYFSSIFLIILIIIFLIPLFIFSQDYYKYLFFLQFFLLFIFRFILFKLLKYNS